AVGVLAGDAEAAAADDVAGVGMVPLVEDPGRSRERAGDRDQREALELGLLEVGEERHAAKQLDRARGPHRMLHQCDYRHTSGQLAAAVSLRGPRAKPAWSSASSWPEPITGSPSSFSIESFGSRPADTASARAPIASPRAGSSRSARRRMLRPPRST